MAIRIAPLEAYQLWSETWDTDPSAIVALEARYVSPWLSDLEGKRVLDVSCGTGRWLAYAQARGAVVFGTDLCREMLLRAAAKEALSGRLAIADARHLPLRSSCADVVLCALSLGHMRPMQAVLAEMASAVRPGGRLIVSDFHPDALERGWKRTFRSNGQSYEIETYPYTKQELIDRAHETGLVLEQALEPGFDEPERRIFDQAGKPDLFQHVRGVPAILLAKWRRP